MNRIVTYLADPLEPEERQDYFEISAFFHTYTVSRRVAMEVERALDQRPAPRWVIFRDITGARHRVAAELIQRISESTPLQRRIEREFRRAREEEERDGDEERPWE